MAWIQEKEKLYKLSSFNIISLSPFIDFRQCLACMGTIFFIQNSKTIKHMLKKIKFYKFWLNVHRRSQDSALLAVNEWVILVGELLKL